MYYYYGTSGKAAGGLASIAFVSAGNGVTNIGSGASTQFDHTISGTNRLLYITMVTTNCVPTSVTVGGSNATQIGSPEVYSGIWNLYQFYFIAPTVGTTTIVINKSVSGGDVFANSQLYTGVNQTTPIGSFANNDATSEATTTTNTTTTVNKSWLVGAGWSQNAMTMGTATTERFALNGGVTKGFDSNGEKTPVGSYSLQTTQTAGFTMHVIASLAPAPL